MPSINDLYPSKWLVAADLSGPTAVTIERVTVETMKGQDGKADEPKPIVFFSELSKGLVCNKTNARTIATFYGDDTDDWCGEKITIYPTKVSWGSKMVDAIRVDTKLPKRAKKGQPEPVAARPAPSDDVVDVDDDEDPPF